MAHPEARTVMLDNGFPDWTQSTCAVCGSGWPCMIAEQGIRLGNEHYCLTCQPILGWLKPVYSGCQGRLGQLLYHTYCFDLMRAVQVATYRRNGIHTNIFDLIANCGEEQHDR